MTTQNTFTDTIREMWKVRPPRIPSEQGGNAKVAGVCEGIGVRYQIDPTIVRVLFLVSLFTLGGGLAAYLLAWMVMPRYGMSTSPVEAVISRKEALSPPEVKERSTGWWLIVFFLLTSVGGGTESLIASTSLLAIALLLASWWLLHQRTPQPPAGLLADAPDQTMSSPVDLTGYTPAEGTDIPPGHVTPPSWDPLGVAPFAWDLPEPGPAPTTPPRKPRVWPWVALGLVGTLSVLAVLGGVFGTYIYRNTDIGEDLAFTPVSEAELQTTYQGKVGALEVDFRQLPTLETAHSVVVSGGVGPVNVHLPSDIPVQLDCVESLSRMECEPGLYNPAAPGATLTLDVEGGVGPMKVSVPQGAAARN